MDRRTLAVLAALLLHVVFLGAARVASRWIPVAPASSPPLLVELDPPRESARKARERKLLLAPHPRSSREEDAPENARYFSDRNQRVSRETRARDAGVADLSRLQSPTLRESLRTHGEGPQAASQPRPALSGQAQRLDDEQATEGAENLLNTVQSIHYSFYSRMYGSLAPVWQSLVRNTRLSRSLSPGDYTVVADLVLDDRGNLIGVVFRERSAIDQFNEAVVASARRIGKFPNPPRELIDSNREVRTMWSFTVNVDDRSVLRLAPPQRID